MLRNGVVAAAAPGIAAKDALETEPEAFQRAVFAESLERILGAGRSEPAAGLSGAGRLRGCGA